MVLSDGYQEEENHWDVLFEEIRERLDNSRRELAEIALMMEQSQSRWKNCTAKCISKCSIAKNSRAIRYFLTR